MNTKPPCSFDPNNVGEHDDANDISVTVVPTTLTTHENITDYRAHNQTKRSASTIKLTFECFLVEHIDRRKYVFRRIFFVRNHFQNEHDLVLTDARQSFGRYTPYVSINAAIHWQHKRATTR